MSAIKDGRVPLLLDKQRYLLFTLNALDEVQDKFGGYDKIDVALQGKDAIKNIKYLLALLINEGKAENEEDLTEQQIGKLVHMGNLLDARTAIFQAFNVGMVGDSKSEDLETDNTMDVGGYDDEGNYIDDFEVIDNPDNLDETEKEDNSKNVESGQVK